jgi:uncharacterized protein with GYD domain
MPRYLVSASYNPDGVKGLLKSGGTARVEAVRTMVEAIGGKMHSFDFAFGSDDVYALVEVDDHVSAAALSLAVNATGLVALKLTVLLTPAEIDDAAGRTVAYRPPGS